MIYSYPEHVIDEVHQAPEEKWGAIHCIFLHCFVCESMNKSKEVNYANEVNVIQYIELTVQF